MTKLLPTGLLTLGLVFLAVASIIPMAGAATTGPVAFGMDSASIGPQTAAGAKPDYGTFWIGPWTLSSGWGGPDNELATMNSAGVTPAVHFYYWGDDITPSCVENGCWSSLHNAQKDRAHWNLLADQLVSHMQSKMGGKPVVIFVESEFNKGGISTYEPFDGYMADMMARLHAGYPNAKLVLGFGNWDSGNWKNFDRAAAASDMVGIQGMRGSTRQAKIDMYTLYDGLLAGVKTLETTFPGKAIMLTDIAVSSYPEPEYLAVQNDVLAEVFNNLATLKSHGVQAMIYRSWNDSPNMNLANYYGEAERHWGVAYSGSSLKPAASVWIDGVKAERASIGITVTLTTTITTTTTSTATSNTTTTVATTSSSPTSSSTTSVPAFTASFAPAAGVNEWWVEVKVTSNAALARVDATVNGASHALAKTSWGNYAASFQVPKGTAVVFKATDTTGRTVSAAPIAWLMPAGTVPTTTTTTAPATTSAFTASFAPKSVGNNWWVESGVTANKAITKVQAKINGGALVDLPKDNWGTYAKSINAPNNSKVVFVATASTGQTVTSQTYTWT